MTASLRVFNQALLLSLGILVLSTTGGCVWNHRVLNYLTPQALHFTPREELIEKSRKRADIYDQFERIASFVPLLITPQIRVFTADMEGRLAGMLPAEAAAHALASALVTVESTTIRCYVLARVEGSNTAPLTDATAAWKLCLRHADGSATQPHTLREVELPETIRALYGATLLPLFRHYEVTFNLEEPLEDGETISLMALHTNFVRAIPFVWEHHVTLDREKLYTITESAATSIFAERAAEEGVDLSL